MDELQNNQPQTCQSPAEEGLVQTAPAAEEAPAVAGTPAAPVTVCDIQFRPGAKIYFFDPNGLTLKAGDHVIMDTSRGQEYGCCTAGNHPVPAAEVVAPLRKVLRLATARDEQIHEENCKKEKRAYEVCLQKIADFGLDMQLVRAECAFDGSKILFFFTADGRVDFRELVKSLASVFRTRIELRQIGVRDKAKMVGGLGICGRPFCCAQFLDDFQPVSIKMAKTQSLSLNPAKISGTCGRLMCCLKYEQEAYEELLKTSPKAESFVDTPDGRGTVTDVNLMRQSVRVRMEKDPEDIHCYKNCEICVLRNGKARKTDPPIPDDLAPISGNRQRQVADPYPRFERRLNTAAQERKPETVPQKPEGDAAPKSEPSHRSRRRGGRGHGRQEQQAAMEKAVQKQERPPQSQKAVAPKAAPAARQEQRQDNRQQPAGEQKRRSKSHRYYHNKRPKKPEQS